MNLSRFGSRTRSEAMNPNPAFNSGALKRKLCKHNLTVIALSRMSGLFVVPMTTTPSAEANLSETSSNLGCLAFEGKQRVVAGGNSRCKPTRFLGPDPPSSEPGKTQGPRPSISASSWVKALHSRIF